MTPTDTRSGCAPKAVNRSYSARMPQWPCVHCRPPPSAGVMAEVLKALCDGSSKQATPGGQVVPAKVPRNACFQIQVDHRYRQIDDGEGRFTLLHDLRADRTV